MALDIPILLGSPSDELGNSVVSAAINIPNGSKCLVMVANDNTGVANVCSDSSGLTWTEQFAAADSRTRVFGAVGNAESSATTITVTKAGATVLHIVNIGNGNLTPVQTQEIVSIGGSNKILTLAATRTAGNTFLGFIIHTAVQATTDNNISLANVTIVGKCTSVSSYTTTSDSLSWTHAGTTSAAYGMEITEEAADITAPILTLPAASSITSSGVTPQVTTDEANGTVYMVVVPDANVPSVAQIKAGQQSSGAAAVANSNQAVSSTGLQNITPVTGLVGSTNYEIYFVHSDAIGNDSIAVTIGFATTVPIPSLDFVDSPIAFGDTINFTTSNMSTITSRTISDGVSIISLSGTDTTAILPGLADEVSRLLTGTVTFEVSDGIATENTTITLNPPVNYSSVKLTSGFITDNKSFLFAYGGVPAIGDEFIYLTSEITLVSDGNWETPSQGTTTIYAIDATDGFMESFNLITTDISDDITPDQFSLGDDITNATLNSITEINFIAAGINVDITWTATGAGQVSLTSGSGFGASVVAGNGVRIYFRLVASGNSSTLVIGGIIAGLVSDSMTVTTASPVFSVTDSLFSALAVPVANQTLDYILRQTWNGAITDQGTLTTDAAGQFTITNLVAVAGSAWISIKNQTADDIATIFTITVA